MGEIKPVYQYKTAGMLINYWQDVDEEIFVKINKDHFYTTRILYPAAAYEALQKENAELKERVKTLLGVIAKRYTDIIELNKKLSATITENESQAKRIAELEENNGLLQTQVHCLEIVAESKNGDKP